MNSIHPFWEAFDAYDNKLKAIHNNKEILLDWLLILAKTDERLIHVLGKHGRKAEGGMEKQEEMLTLIDGAKVIVELFNAESPAQKVWKQRWLKNADAILRAYEGGGRDEKI